MSVDGRSIVPNPTNWFESCVQYEGHGRAEFSDPRGSVEGPASARFDEYGNYSIELEIQRCESGRELHFGVFGLLSGGRTIETEGCVEMGFGGMENSCTRFTITSPQGTFTATGKILYDLREHRLFSDSGKLRLYPLRSQFDAVGAAVPRYWVVPLFNLICKPVLRHPGLDRHPLRIYQTFSLPDGLTRDELPIAIFEANERNRLIIFQYGGELAFIERLQDFEDRERRLLAGRERTLITAVMVGSIGTDTVDHANLRDWPVIELLHVLGFASGIETGSPWVELRNSNGELVRRVHVTLGRHIFCWGPSPINEDCNPNTGYILNKYLSSPERGKPHLLVSMDYAVKAGLSGPTLEEKWVSLCRGFEAICNGYGFKTQNLLHDLDPCNAEGVKDALKKAADEIRLRAESVRAKNGRQAARMGQIAKRAEETPIGVDRSFGLAVVELLDHFRLPDVAVAEKHYAANMSLHKNTWVQSLSKYRAACVHRGYFELQDEEDLHIVYQLFRHLHDILVRLVLKMVRYDGPYQPSTITLTAVEPVDWVKPDTRPDLLGYKVSSS